MKKHIRRLVSFLASATLALSIGFGILPQKILPSSISVSAADSSGKLENGLEYQIINGKASITGCDESVISVDIPAEIESYPVTIIREYAFYAHTSLRTITIPESVTSIGDSAFLGAQALNQSLFQKI